MRRISKHRLAAAIVLASLFAIVAAQTANAGHVRPKSASPQREGFVISFKPCGAPTGSHGPAFSFPSCSPPTPTSANLTVGEPLANGFPANFVGVSKLNVCPVAGCAAPDIKITLSLTDVRCTAALAGTAPAMCPGGGLGPYTGTVVAQYPLKITDHCNVVGGPPPAACPPGIPPGPPGPPATVVMFTFPMPVFGCAIVMPGVGSTCAIGTTFNALVPGAIPGGQRMNIGIGQVTVNDGGPDGDATTAPNDAFVEAGVFVP
jgi:hypothetical protein